jgi:hypothetical protein
LTMPSQATVHAVRGMDGGMAADLVGTSSSSESTSRSQSVILSRAADEPVA